MVDTGRGKRSWEVAKLVSGMGIEGTNELDISMLQCTPKATMSTLKSSILAPLSCGLDPWFLLSSGSL